MSEGARVQASERGARVRKGETSFEGVRRERWVARAWKVRSCEKAVPPGTAAKPPYVSGHSLWTSSVSVQLVGGVHVPLPVLPPDQVPVAPLGHWGHRSLPSFSAWHEEPNW